MAKFKTFFKIFFLILSHCLVLFIVGLLNMLIVNFLVSMVAIEVSVSPAAGFINFYDNIENFQHYNIAAFQYYNVENFQYYCTHFSLTEGLVVGSGMHDILGGSNIYPSVLEQFAITQFTLAFDVWLQIMYTYKFVFGLFVDFIEKINYFPNYFPNITRLINWVGQYLWNILRIVLPIIYIIKSYFYFRAAGRWIGRLLNLFFKKRLLVFLRFNNNFYKEKAVSLIIQTVQAAFDKYYKVRNRLLNSQPLFATAALVVGINNFLGLLLFGFTTTAFFLHNVLFSFYYVVGATLQGIFFKSYEYYKNFLPGDVPTLLKPFIGTLEVVSHISKIFSLSIRILANMTAGHILLHILTGFILVTLQKSLMIAIFPAIIVVLIVGLEYGICILQTYVFLTLISLYTNEGLTETQKTLSRVMSYLKLVSKGLKALIMSFIYCVLKQRRTRKRCKLERRILTTFFEDRTNDTFWNLSIFTNIYCKKI